jgi:hypothetical protein
MALSQTEKLKRIHADALTEFDEVQSAVRDERKQCLEDRRFYSIAGAMWEGTLGEQFENKPKFEVNKIHLAVIRIINEYRNNRITVDFVSKDGSADDTLADACDSLYRADEQDSTANEAYDNAFEEAVGGGFGAFRLRATYEDDEDDEDERQRIRIEPIYDADTCVFFDLQAKRQDKSDATKCWVLTSMTRSAYTTEYKDDPASWPKDITSTYFDWATPDLIYIAEYYRVETVAETVYYYQAIDGSEERYTDSDFEDDEELLGRLKAIGTKKLREKKAKRKRVHKYIMSGSGILEDCGIIAGPNIPVVVVYGKRWFVDGIERCMGHVRLAKDVARLKNMQLSKLGEISALSSVEKPIFLPEQIAGNEDLWADDNTKNYPYLLVNPITDAAGQTLPSGPIGYTRAPQIPPAMAALLQITEQDMAEILGRADQGEQIASNLSGKAVELIQNSLGMQTYIYVSNFSKGVQRAGQIWLGMARELYVEKGRKMKGVGTQGELSTLELGRPIEKDGIFKTENDLTKASFDVVAEVGPSSSSKKSGTVKNLIEMIRITTDPETSSVLQSMAMMNMEGEGLQDTRDYFRNRLVKMGVVKATPEEQQEMAQAAANQPPDPNAKLADSLANEADANAAKARADTVGVIAKSELTHAQTIETLAGIEVSKQDAAIKMAQAIQGAQAQQAEFTPAPAQPATMSEI